MKLETYTVYHTKQGYWLYTGLGGDGFSCDVCGKERQHTHEFLLYPNLTDIQNDLRINDLGRFNNNEHYGTECVKVFLAQIQADLIEILSTNK